MGIVGLVRFLTRLGGCSGVNVLEEIRKSERKEPLIVVDLLSMVYALSGPIDEQIYGCRNQFAWTQASQFCDKMIGAGARLVFFIDGRLHEGKYKYWIMRQEKVYAESLKKLDTIPSEFKGKTRGNIQGNVTKHAFIAALMSAARQKGMLITTYDIELDREIAAFANKHDALAIFTGDSDFLIYEGRWRVWSSSDLNLDIMRTFEWNKELLRKELKLEWNQMPFFAVLAGNDHFKHRPSGICTFYKVAHKVNELQLRFGITNVTIQLYEKIYKKKDENMKNSLEDGLRLYDLNYSIKKPLVPPEMRHYPNYALCIIRNIPGTIRLPCLDLREAEYSQIALQIYRRQVGMLYRHRSVVFGQTLTAKVFIKPSHNEPYKIVAVTPITPPLAVRVPLPEQLYSLDADLSEKLTPIKYKLLCWLVSDTLSFEEIQCVHPNYLLDVMTLYYLVENNFLDVTTADIILIAIHECITNAIPRVLPLKRPRKSNLQTSFLYVHFYAQIYFCAETAGFRKEMDSFFLCKFDGVYFNQIVDKLRYDFAGLEAKTESIKHLRLYSKFGNHEQERVQRIIPLSSPTVPPPPPRQQYPAEWTSTTIKREPIKREPSYGEPPSKFARYR